MRMPIAFGLVTVTAWLGGVLPWESIALGAAEAGHRAANPVPPPASALGYPSRAPDLDVLPGFRNPPPGYGEVPFWWWTGDPLDKDRLLWQIEELHRQGIAGVQVNYAHEDTPGWPTYRAEPEIFSGAWWEIWGYVAAECGKRDMGIGLSGYTLDWPNGRSLVSRTIYSEPAIVGRELKVASRTRVAGGHQAKVEVPADAIGVRAYRARADKIDPVGQPVALAAAAGSGEWTAPAGEGEWEVWVYASVAKPGALNPMHPWSGKRVIEKFFQPFQDHAPGQSSRGLNYFFHDELQFGVGEHLWTEDFAEQFRARKGYEVWEALPALFADAGAKTPKLRMDYLDVRMQLIQERYFEPIFGWHWSRGLIYGCDQGSRGTDPLEFGDYFSAVRWYTAPGHDTPGGHADLIKGKVSSSIAQLYRRPRVWLEGYHSLGWGATPARLMQATCENYVYGCNLLNLHGLYYTTHGSFWEWAPPCYHFRMPYWDHMGVFLKYFERLSYLMSQGVHQCDVAVVYPVSPGQAGLGGREATDLAFNFGRRLFEAGRDFIYIDEDSIQRAQVEGGRLHVSEASYRVLVLPAMRAVRWSTLQQAQALYRAGGMVIAVGALPEASDRAGRDDPELDALVGGLFGATAAETKAGRRPGIQRRLSGGRALAIFPERAAEAGGAPGTGNATVDRLTMETQFYRVLETIPRDVVCERPVKAVHRRVGPRDVYLVMGAPRGAECIFQASGRVELWDPWTGEVRPILAVTRGTAGTRIRMPLAETEAQLVVFSPGENRAEVTKTDLDEVRALDVGADGLKVVGFAARPGPKRAVVEVGGRRMEAIGEAVAGSILPLEGDWEFTLKPTLNNRWGDFRLPATDPLLGAEARLFRYHEERGERPAWEAPELDDSGWLRVTHGFGPQLWVLGPLPADGDAEALDARLAALTHVAPEEPVEIGGRRHSWKPYAFSWRWGKEGDPGHQGWHGLKENVTDDFLCLGKPGEGLNEVVYGREEAGTRYYVWTSAYAETRAPAELVAGGLPPVAVYLKGTRVAANNPALVLEAGSNPLLVRYEGPGRGHLVVRKREGEMPPKRLPLAMQWCDDPRVVAYDVRPTEAAPAGWYRFVAPPGLRGLTITAHGEVEVWVEGRPCTVTPRTAAARPDGAKLYRVELSELVRRRAQVALRIQQERGRYGGAALPEPIALECGTGWSNAGDWTVSSVLENYSGGAWYRRDFVLEPGHVGGRVRVDLGEVVATAEVRVNGERAGVRVAPPWVVDVSAQVHVGTNRLEVLVYNTLANHYRTIPTRYRGELKSGLIGPVCVRVEPTVVLTGNPRGSPGQAQ